MCVAILLGRNCWVTSLMLNQLLIVQLLDGLGFCIEDVWSLKSGHVFYICVVYECAILLLNFTKDEGDHFMSTNNAMFKK